jgi:hypothetical protein
MTAVSYTVKEVNEENDALIKAIEFTTGHSNLAHPMRQHPVTAEGKKRQKMYDPKLTQDLINMKPKETVS